MKRQILLKDHWFFGPVLNNKKEYWQVIASSIFINLFALVSAFFVMIVYDRIIPNNATESLIVLTIGIIIIIAFDLVMKVMRGEFTDRAGANIDKEISEKLFHRLSRNEKLIGKPVGSTATIVKEFETLRDFMGSATFVTFVDLPFIILFLFVLYSIGGMVAAVPAIIVLSVIVIGLLVQPIIRKLSINAALDGQSKQATLVEMLSGLETLKTLPGIELLYNRWMKSVSKQNEVSSKSKFWSQLTSNISQSAQQISQVGIVFYAVYLIADGEMTMGSLIACVILSGRTLAPLGQISGLLGRLNQAIAAYKGFGELMTSDVSEIEKSRQLRVEDVAGSVTIENVSLTYPNQKIATIKNIDIKIAAGEKVAVVGKIGSGKTSILRLLSGLMEATSGSIKIDNSDISHLHPDDIRKHVGVVMQQSVIFSGTLKENLLLGNPNASDSEIMEAAKIAGVDQIAANLPNGFNTVFSEGGQELSGGQKQSISVARAFVGNPKIIIMDEPSSAMDMESEQRLLKDLTIACRDKTLILITHGRSLLKLVDRIIEIDTGKIIRDEILGREKVINSQGAVRKVQIQHKRKTRE